MRFSPQVNKAVLYLIRSSKYLETRFKTCSISQKVKKNSQFKKNLGQNISFGLRNKTGNWQTQTSYIAEVFWISLVKTAKKTAHWVIFCEFFCTDVFQKTFECTLHGVRGLKNFQVVSTRFLSSVFCAILHP